MDINIVLEKLDRLQELIWDEDVDSSDIMDCGSYADCYDYAMGLWNGMEMAMALLQDREPILIEEVE